MNPPTPTAEASPSAVRRPGVTPPSRRGGSGRRLDDVVVDLGFVDRGEMDAAVAEGQRTGSSPERARRLVAELGGRAVERAEPADLVVQCTSVGLSGDEGWFKRLPIGADAFGAGTCVVDMVYRAGGTAFLAAARSSGGDVVDGLEVLVGQGAAALERWTGRAVPIDEMRRAVTDDADG